MCQKGATETGVTTERKCEKPIHPEVKDTQDSGPNVSQEWKKKNVSRKKR
jgi:hypothetical protein